MVLEETQTTKIGNGKLITNENKTSKRCTTKPTTILIISPKKDSPPLQKAENT
jgi:hypothetical protein